MTKADNGYHCQSCDKVVIDFEGMSTREILAFFRKRGSELRLSGKFGSRQLESLNAELQAKKKSNILFILLLVTGLALTSCNSHRYVQATNNNHWNAAIIIEKTISDTTGLDYATDINGVIVDSYGDPLEFVNVLIGPDTGVISGKDGKFHLQSEQLFFESTMVTFSYVGYMPVSIPVSDINHRNVKVSLHEGYFLGEIVLRHEPFYKRAWHGVKSVFGKRG